MNTPRANKAELLEAWSGVANFALLLLVSVAGFIRFSTIDRSLARVETELTQAELAEATTPVLAIEPRLTIGPALGKQFNATKLRVNARNIGKGVLQLGTVEVRVSQCLLPTELADSMSEAAKRKYSDEYESSLAETRVVPISRYDLEWKPVDGTVKRYELSASLLAQQDASFYVDYVLEPSAKPHLLRFEVTLSPANDANWEPRTADLIASFGAVPSGFGEAIQRSSGSASYTVSAPVNRPDTVAAISSFNNTLTLKPLEQ